MEKLIIFLFLVLLSADLLAQNSSRKGFIGITLGPSIPIGDFADNSSGNENAGFANTGLNMSPIIFGYRFSQNFGISASWFGATYAIDNSGVDALWSYGGLMGGPILTFPVNEKLSFDLKGMIGFVSATSNLSDYEENEGTGVAFDLGASFRYDFAEKWCLLMNGDYFTSNPKLEEESQIMSSINLSFGVAYRLK